MPVVHQQENPLKIHQTNLLHPRVEKVHASTSSYAKIIPCANERDLYMYPLPDPRQQALYEWAAREMRQERLAWQPLAGDAGARRYFKISGGKNFLAVDSPNEAVDNPQFIALAQALTKAGLHVPEILAADLSQGFLLINELSTQHYLDVLTDKNADALYESALQALLKLHNSKPYLHERIKPWVVADYYQELTDMPLWLFEKHLQVRLTTGETAALEKVFHDLINNMLVQPQVVVHRDYHSRNLLFCAENNPGIIDFQDIFIGPITYDIVSLFRDAYIAWPWERVLPWIEKFYRMLPAQSQAADFEQFMHWFHGMTLQRGIKILGRFPRLCYRDNKPKYIADLPPIAAYVLHACQYYPGMNVVEDILGKYLVPRLQETETCAP